MPHIKLIKKNAQYVFTIEHFFLSFIRNEKNMITNFILWLEIFIFILCLLNILKHIYIIFKVMYMKSGKIESNSITMLLLGFSISYIITTLITGF